MRCPHCGQEHPDSSIFCPTTGRKLVRAHFCSNCGAEIRESWKVCPKCGTPVNEPKQTGSSIRKQGAKSKLFKTLRTLWIPVLFSIIILALTAYLVFPGRGIFVNNLPSEVSGEIGAVEGGELALSDNTRVTIPSNSLKEDTQASIRKTASKSAPALSQELVSVGNAYLIELGANTLEQPVTLEIPFDPALIPDGVDPSQIFLSYYDEDQREWVFAGGHVDTTRNVVILETSHASWWMPTTWNWDAWIAVLNNLLEVNISGLIDAVTLIIDDCPQTGEYVNVDSSQAHQLVQGCIEQDEAEQVELRIVNPKSFYFEVKPVSNGNQASRTEMLSPGEDLTFNALTSDPSPLTIEANVTQKSGWYLVIHMVLTMLPGASQFGIQPHHVACITERMADSSYFFEAVGALFLDHDGVAAGDNIREFLKNKEAFQRFIRVADDCNFGPAPTWSWEGARQIGGATSTILTVTDYAANYFAGNTPARVSFIWESPVPQSEDSIAFLNENNIWLIRPDGSGLTQITTNNSDNPRVISFRWSADGKTLAYSLGSPSGNAIILYDVQTSTKTPIVTGVGGGFDWSLTNRQIIYDTPPKPSDPWSDKGLWLLRLDNGRTRQIFAPTDNNAGFRNPQLSSEGSHVIFTIPAFEPVGYGVADLTTGQSKNLPLNVLGGAGAGNCEWAPSELKIACTTLTDEFPYEPELRFMDVNGNVLEKIPLPEKMGNPIVEWSPDGQKLAIGYYNEGKAWTDILPLNTKDLQTLSSGFPSDWSPDGQWILTWESGINVPATIAIVNISSGQSVHLSEGFLATWQP